MDNRCMNCNYWGPESRLGLERETWLAYALCHRPTIQQYDWTPQDYWCCGHKERTGEPLGTGLAKAWLMNKFLSASIVHDLDYEILKPGESTETIDKKYLANCLLLSKGFGDKVLALVFYSCARIYGGIYR